MLATERSLERLIGRRASQRSSCDLVVEFKDGGSVWKRALLKDISATGFRLARIGPPPAGKSLWLRPAGMDPLPAKIRWTTDGEVGCEFLYPLGEKTEGAIRQLGAQADRRVKQPASSPALV